MQTATNQVPHAHLYDPPPRRSRHHSVSVRSAVAEPCSAEAARLRGLRLLRPCRRGVRPPRLSSVCILLFSAAAHAAGHRPGGRPVCSGLPYGTEARALVIWMPERRCCCALAAQAFCARSSRWSRCSCSRPWPSAHFSCAPLLNTHTRAHARTHTHARATGRRATPCRTPPHAHRSWARAPVLGTRASVQNTPAHSHAHTPPNCAP